MKRQDLYFALVMLAIFLPFFLFEPAYAWYTDFNKMHPMVMAFLKFGILATLGEMLGCRISTGNYTTPTFGVAPRMVVWGLLGVVISMAMSVFAVGIPAFIANMGGTDLVAQFMGEGITLGKFVVALAEKWVADEPIVISAADGEALKKYFAAKAKALLDKGVTIEEVNGQKVLFTIKPADGSYKVNFGEEEFVNFFKSFLRPELVEMLF